MKVYVYSARGPAKQSFGRRLRSAAWIKECTGASPMFAHRGIGPSGSPDRDDTDVGPMVDERETTIAPKRYGAKVGGWHQFVVTRRTIRSLGEER